MAAGDHTVTGTMTANKVAVADTVVVANLNADQVDGADKDIELFTGPDRLRRRSLYGAVDRIRDRWGHAAVVMGPSVDLLGRLQQNDYGFVLRTPSLTK